MQLNLAKSFKFTEATGTWEQMDSSAASAFEKLIKLEYLPDGTSQFLI